jgi:hypothetical protein
VSKSTVARKGMGRITWRHSKFVVALYRFHHVEVSQSIKLPSWQSSWTCSLTDLPYRFSSCPGEATRSSNIHWSSSCLDLRNTKNVPSIAEYNIPVSLSFSPALVSQPSESFYRHESKHATDDNLKDHRQVDTIVSRSTTKVTNNNKPETRLHYSTPELSPSLPPGMNGHADAMQTPSYAMPCHALCYARPKRQVPRVYAARLPPTSLLFFSKFPSSRLHYSRSRASRFTGNFVRRVEADNFPLPPKDWAP